MLSVQIPSAVRNSPVILTIHADVGVDSVDYSRSVRKANGKETGYSRSGRKANGKETGYSRSVLKANGKETGYSRSIRPIWKGFGECSRRIRCDIKPNETFELYSERDSETIPGGC